MGLTGIYKITCLITKQVYIGCSINLNKRYLMYKWNQIDTQPLIQQSISQYGWEHHTFEIIEECSLELLKERECYWIHNYDSFNNGLNANKGGGGPLFHSDETKQKMKKPKPKGFGEKISKIKKGKKNPKLGIKKKNKPSAFKGHKHSDLSKQKMRMHKLGKTYEEIFEPEVARLLKMKRSLPRKGKSIICINNNQIYSSIKEAALKLDINPNSISNILRKKALKTENGLTFKYADKINN